MNCTNCSKEINDIKVSIVLNINIERKTESGLWENIPNGNLNPKECLCSECFSVFSETLGSALNKVNNV